MTDFETLYLILACCYLMECCVLVNGCPVLFLRLLRRWKVLQQPGFAFGRNKRLLMLNPLPWLARWHVCATPCCTVTGRGVVSVNSWRTYTHMPPPPSLLLPQSPQMQECLTSLQASGFPDVETKTIPTLTKEHLRRWTDPAPAIATFTLLSQGLWWLHALTTAQFILIFIAPPLLIALYPPDSVIIPFLSAMLLLNTCIAVAFAEKYHALYPNKLWIALAKAAWMLVYPLNAIRAVQVLCAPLHLACHESALAYALMNKRDGAEYLALSLNRLRRQNFSRSLAPSAFQALVLANHMLRRAIDKHWGISSYTAPSRIVPEHGATCFCPLCGISLNHAAAFCLHCLEVRTLSAPTPQKTHPPLDRAAFLE